MRALVQRVAEASVEIDGVVVGRIAHGLLILLGVAVDDEEADAEYLAPQDSQPAHLCRWRKPLQPLRPGRRAEALVVSQFTLYADTRRGRRPDFTRAAPPELAERLYEHTVALHPRHRADRRHRAVSKPICRSSRKTTARSPSCWTARTVSVLGGNGFNHREHRGHRGFFDYILYNSPWPLCSLWLIRNP